MSAAGRLRTVVFGDARGDLWGAAVSGPSAAIVLGERGGAGWSGALASWEQEGRGWRLEGPGLALHVEPAGEDASAPEASAGERVTGFQELCQVSGEVELGGSRREVQCVGTRCALEGVEPGEMRSARVVSGWFGADDAFLLLALRGERQVSHEEDMVAATLFDPEGWVAVAEPRLSTTYDREGVPTRVNLELWVGEGESEFPRRAAGEAAGPGAALDGDGIAIRVVPLRCHSRGREGAGAYVLVGL